MTNRTAANRYARALFDVAVKEKRTSPRSSASWPSSSICSNNIATFGKVLLNPAVPAPRKRAAVAAVISRPSCPPPSANLLVLLAERDRFMLLPDLLAAFRQRVLRPPEHRPGRGRDRGAALRGTGPSGRARSRSRHRAGHVQMDHAGRPVADRRRGRAHWQHRLRREHRHAPPEDETTARGKHLGPRRNRHGHQSRRDLQNHPRPDRQLRRRRRRGRGRQHHFARRRHRPHSRRRERDGGRDAGVPSRRVRDRAEPRGRKRRRGSARRVHGDQGRRSGQAHRPHHLGAGRRGDARPRRQRARPADRRQGPDQHASSSRRSSGWHRASSTGNRSKSRCRPASRRSTRWCRSAAASAS